MTKADLIEEVSRVAELTRKDSEVVVETIFDSVVRSLRAGDKIEIRSFGSFRTRQRKSRVGRNPKTGARVEVPAKKIPFFKPSKELKDLVNWVSSALCKPVIVPSNVRQQKVQITAPGLVNQAEAYRMFLAALTSMGLTIQPEGTAMVLLRMTIKKY